MTETTEEQYRAANWDGYDPDIFDCEPFSIPFSWWCGIACICFAMMMAADWIVP